MARMSYTIHESINLVELTPIGDIDTGSLLRYSRELIDAGAVRRGTVEYVDFSRTGQIAIDYIAAHALSEMRREWLSQGWIGSVFHTPTEVHFGIVRMLGSLVESLPGATEGLMIPQRERMQLTDIRGFLESQLVARGRISPLDH